MWKRIDGKWKWGTKHTFYDKRPQSSFEHWKVAFFGSLEMMAIALGGVIHSFIDVLFPFTVPRWVMKRAVAFAKDPRHKETVAEVFLQSDIDYLQSCVDEAVTNHK